MMQRTITAAVRRARATWAVCIVLLTCMSLARAQDAEFARKLTLKEAVTLAVGNSRDLALARLQYGLVQREGRGAGGVFCSDFYTGTGAAYTEWFSLISGGGSPAVFCLSYPQPVF